MGLAMACVSPVNVNQGGMESIVHGNVPKNHMGLLSLESLPTAHQSCCFTLMGKVPGALS